MSSRLINLDHTNYISPNVIALLKGMTNGRQEISYMCVLTACLSLGVKLFQTEAQYSDSRSMCVRHKKLFSFLFWCFFFFFFSLLKIVLFCNDYLVNTLSVSCEKDFSVKLRKGELNHCSI